MDIWQNSTLSFVQDMAPVDISLNWKHLLYLVKYFISKASILVKREIIETFLPVIRIGGINQCKILEL